MLYYYDVVSMYPWVMVNHELPYGDTYYEAASESTKFLEGVPVGVRGFIRIRVTGGNSRYNMIRVNQKNIGLVAPFIKNPMTIIIYSAELDFIRKNNDIFGYEWEVLGWYHFKHARFLAGITEEFFALKTASKGNPPVYRAAKERLNSIYGHFGIRMWSKQMVLVNRAMDFRTLVSSGHLIESSGSLAIVNRRIMPSIRSTAIAAAITSLAHVRLMENILVCLRADHKVFYCDTDSLITTAGPEIIEEIQPIGLGLGEMEVEMIASSGVFTARKIYALRGVADHIKIKGVSKGPYKTREDTPEGPIFRGKGGDVYITMEDLEGLIHGKAIQVEVFRVYGGKTRYIHREGVKGATVLIKITGRFTNGTVLENGEVIPVIIR